MPSLVIGRGFVQVLAIGIGLPSNPIPSFPILAAVSISIACLMNVKFSDNFLARDLLIASLALVMVSFSVLQWFSFRRRRQVMDQMKGIEQQNGISTIAAVATVNEGQREVLFPRRTIYG